MKKFALGIVLLAIVVYIGAVVYNAFVSTVLTEPVSKFTAYDDITCTGFVLRSEMVLRGADGVIGYLVSDGEKVAKDAGVAAVYSSQSDIELRDRIKTLDRMINALSYAQSPSGLLVSDPVAIEEMIRKEIININDMIYKGADGSIFETKNTLTLLLNRKKLALGEVSGFDAEIERLAAEKRDLESKLNPSIGEVVTGQSGYFTSSIDGYESILTVEGINTLDVKTLEGLEKRTVIPEKNGVVGKVITDFEWYFACVLEGDDLKRIRAGQRIEMTFPFVTGRRVSASVYHISREEEGRAVVVFKSETIINELNLIRHQTANIILKSYDGIKVPKNAVRTVDGQKGVYVLIGAQARFRKADIIEGEYLYNQDEYVLAVLKDPMLERSTPLLVSDEVIVQAKDLYDGKIVK